jgi:hypothetical protein
MEVEVAIEELDVRIPVVKGVLGGRERAQASEVLTCCAPRRQLEGTRFEAQAEIEAVSDLFERDLVDRIAAIRASGKQTCCSVSDAPGWC